MTINHTDIRPFQQLEKYFPKSLRPYLYLARLDRPIGIWLLLLPGWWAIVMASGGIAAMDGRDWRIFSLFGIGAAVMRAAGCVINDLWDRDLDKKVARTRARPLASGNISARQGFVFLAGLLAAGLLVLVQMNTLTIVLGFASLPLIVLYPLMKRWTWWPQAFLGLIFNFGALMGWTAASGTIECPAVLLYASGFFWTLAYDTVYAHQDKEDDALAGVKSTALRLGAQSRKWVGGFYTLAFVFLILASIAAYASAVNLAFLLLPAAHVFWRFKKWNSADPANCLITFKSSRDTGLLVLLAVFLAGL